MFDATVIVAALALVGTIVTGFFNFKSAKDIKQTDAERKAHEKAEAEKKRADEAEEKLKTQQLMETFDDIRDSIAAVQANVEKVMARVEDANQHMERINVTLSARIQGTEDSCDKIVQLVAKLAQNYTTLSACHAQTESRIQKLIALETTNMQFTKEIGTIVHHLSTIILDTHPEYAASTDMKNVIDMIESSEKDFLNSMVGSSLGNIRDEKTTTPPPAPTFDVPIGLN